MSKPVTPQEMFELWQKMVNPGAYPLQSLMFPVLDLKEIDRKIAELETVEHWLRANLNMLQVSIKSLEYQRSMLKGGEAAGKGAGDEAANPAMWAWNMMAQAGREAMQAGKEAMDAAQAAPPPAPKKRSPRRAKSG